MNTLHNCLAYYLLAINAVTFTVYKYKAKKAKWRISEATLLLLAPDFVTQKIRIL